MDLHQSQNAKESQEVLPTTPHATLHLQAIVPPHPAPHPLPPDAPRPVPIGPIRPEIHPVYHPARLMLSRVIYKQFVIIRVRKLHMYASTYSFSGHFVLFLYQLAYNSEILSIFAPTYQNLATQFSSNPSPQ